MRVSSGVGKLGNGAEINSNADDYVMDMIFNRCGTVLHLPRGTKQVLGRRRPVAGWDDISISRQHIEVGLNATGELELKTVGRNAVVLERRATSPIGPGARWASCP